MPIPIWDRNKGAIMAAESALVRAEEEPHRVELNLSNTLAAAYTNYKNNLEALEYYRRYILPDQVRAYRGAYDRRQIDPNASFGDVVSAQQTLASNVTTYLQTLGQVWTSVTERGRPDSDGRPVRVCPAASRAAAARAGTVGAVALLPPLRGRWRGGAPVRRRRSPAGEPQREPDPVHPSNGPCITGESGRMRKPLWSV